MVVLRCIAGCRCGVNVFGVEAELLWLWIRRGERRGLGDLDPVLALGLWACLPFYVSIAARVALHGRHNLPLLLSSLGAGAEGPRRTGCLAKREGETELVKTHLLPNSPFSLE